MDYQNVKKTLAPMFLNRGYTALSSNRMFVKDYGLFLVLFEPQPVHGMGFMLNCGVTFCWNIHGHITYDYYEVDSRIPGDPPKTEFLLFDDKQFYQKLGTMSYEIIRQTEEYDKMADLNVLETKLTRFYNERKGKTGIYNSADHLAIVKILLGKTEEARQLMKENQESYFSRHGELFGLTDCAEEFRAYLADVVNCTRADISNKLKIKRGLTDISIEDHIK